MLVDVGTKKKLLPIKVIFFWSEGHQLQRHGKQSYVGEINNKCDYLANVYWLMKEGDNSIHNQLFSHSPWNISFKGKMTAYLDIQEIYDHTHGKTESTSYCQDNQQPFPPEQEKNISWFTIHKAMKKWPWGKAK